MRTKKLIAISLVVLTAFTGSLYGKLRKVGIDDVMPEFSGTEAGYKHQSGTVNVVAFLSSKQKQSLKAAQDLKTILSDLSEHKEKLNLYVITDNIIMRSHFKSANGSTPFNFSYILDNDFEIWGDFGVIATPTFVIADKSDKIIWIKSGYGYDFAPSSKKNLKWALGLAEKPKTAGTAVKTLDNSGIEAEIKRHVRLSKMLEDKGRIEAAIKELAKCKDLKADSIDISLKLGILYCKSEQNQQAIDEVEGLEVKNMSDQAERNLIIGWAKRQLGMLDDAEKHLLDATKHPKSIRAYFELGKVYQAKGDNEKAMKAYYTALTKVFDK